MRADLGRGKFENVEEKGGIIVVRKAVIFN